MNLLKLESLKQGGVFILLKGNRPCVSYKWCLTSISKQMYKNDTPTSWDTPPPMGGERGLVVGRWTCNPEVPGSNPPPCHWMDLSSAAPNSISPRCVNSQLVSLPPVGILNLLCLICIIFVCYAHLNIFKWNLRDINVYYYYYYCAIHQIFSIIHLIPKWQSSQMIWVGLSSFTYGA